MKGALLLSIFNIIIVFVELKVKTDLPKDVLWYCETICEGSGGRSRFNFHVPACVCRIDEHVDESDIEYMTRTSQAIGLPFEIVESKKEHKRSTDDDLKATSTINPLFTLFPKNHSPLLNHNSLFPINKKELKPFQNDGIVGQMYPSLNNRDNLQNGGVAFPEFSGSLLDQLKAPWEKLIARMRNRYAEDDANRQRQFTQININLRPAVQKPGITKWWDGLVGAKHELRFGGGSKEDAKKKSSEKSNRTSSEIQKSAASEEVRNVGKEEKSEEILENTTTANSKINETTTKTEGSQSYEYVYEDEDGHVNKEIKPEDIHLRNKREESGGESSYPYEYVDDDPVNPLNPFNVPPLTLPRFDIPSLQDLNEPILGQKNPYITNKESFLSKFDLPSLPAFPNLNEPILGQMSPNLIDKDTINNGMFHTDDDDSPDAGAGRLRALVDLIPSFSKSLNFGRGGFGTQVRFNERGGNAANSVGAPPVPALPPPLEIPPKLFEIQKPVIQPNYEEKPAVVTNKILQDIKRRVDALILKTQKKPYDRTATAAEANSLTNQLKQITQVNVNVRPNAPHLFASAFGAIAPLFQGPLAQSAPQEFISSKEITEETETTLSPTTVNP